ncbi:MAG: hypothetical protein ACRC92_27180 [Peptostreptococcaceae bacterium]
MNDNIHNIQIKVINGIIREYDMNCAGLSVLAEKNIIDEDLFLDLKDADKDMRNILIGKIQINNEELKTHIADGINSSVDKLKKMIRDKNNILEIAKDAVFILNEEVGNVSQFGEFIRFSVKNKYFLCVEFNITDGGSQHAKIYVALDGLVTRYTTINKESTVYHMVFNLLKYKIENNARMFYRLLPSVKIALLNPENIPLLSNVSNERLYRVLEMIGD